MWPRLEAGRDGYGQYFQRWYGRFNRKFVTEDKKKTFHSTRHVFINFLKQHDISETIIKELVGHSDQSITTGLYGKSYNVKLLYETIQRIDYEVPEALIKIRV